MFTNNNSKFAVPHRPAAFGRLHCLATTLALVVTLGLSAPPLFAAPGEWTRLGPDSASLWGLAIDAGDNDIIYAGASHGIYKTSDGGASWRHIELNTHALTFPDTLVIDPANSNRLIRSSTSGVTLSTDAGESWSVANSTPIPVNFMAVDPADANRIYVARNSAVADKVHVSTDGGANWSAVATGLPAAERMRSFAIDPGNAQHLYASLSVADSADTDLKTVYYSTDGGANWNPAVTGPFTIPNGGSTPENLALQKLVVSPLDGNLVYGFSGYFLFRSNDGGLNWTEVFADLDYTFRDLFFDPADANRLLARVTDEVTSASILRESSTANDAVWTTVSTGFVPGIRQFGRSNGQLVATAASGFYTSDDDGASWSSSSDGLRGTIAAPLVHPHIEGRLYASNESLLRSDDGGQSWTQLGEASVGELVFDPSNADVIYSLEGIGVQRSTDGGHSWSRLDNPSSSTTDMAINPDNGDEMFFISSGFVRRSMDGGLNTERMLDNQSRFATVRFDPLNPDIVYATRDDTGSGRIDVYRSIDGGDSWAGLTELPTPHSGDTSPMVASIARDHVINPQNTLEMYVVTDAGTYKSVDGGVDWILSDSFPSLADLEMHPLDPQTLYASTLFGWVIRTTSNGGASWDHFSATAGFTVSHAAGVRISPHNAQRIYAGSDVGILVTGPDFVPIDYVGVTKSVLKSLKKLEKKRSIRNDRKSKKFAKKARKHLESALRLFKDADIIGGRNQVDKAIADLKKVRKEKKKVKRLINRLKNLS